MAEVIFIDFRTQPLEAQRFAIEVENACEERTGVGETGGYFDRVRSAILTGYYAGVKAGRRERFAFSEARPRIEEKISPLRGGGKLKRALP